MQLTKELSKGNLHEPSEDRQQGTTVAPLKPKNHKFPFLKDDSVDVSLSLYAEDFDVIFPTYENTGYSGLSSVITAAYNPVFSDDLTGHLALEFTVTADEYS